MDWMASISTGRQVLDARDACETHTDFVHITLQYPAEPDIPGIPAGDTEESQNYLDFVKVVKSKMPAGKTVSIAAPASYWYLKQFLIEDMAKVVDYIIYM
jgi:chitinase